MKHIEILTEGAERMHIPLTQTAKERIALFYDLLIDWNERMNLTAITEEKDVIVKHFLDSLSAAPLLSSIGGLTVADIGTGAGFPGIPLAIVFPETPFLLLDSLQKRTVFLREVVQRLDLSNVCVVHGRAEELAHQEPYREKYAVVLSRAVASLPVLLEYCMGYVRPDGLFLAYKGPSVSEEISLAGHALKVLNGRLEEVSEVEIPFSEVSHKLVRIRKTGSLGRSYPRPQAKIKKAPL